MDTVILAWQDTKLRRIFLFLFIQFMDFATTFAGIHAASAREVGMLGASISATEFSGYLIKLLVVLALARLMLFYPHNEKKILGLCLLSMVGPVWNAGQLIKWLLS